MLTSKRSSETTTHKKVLFLVENLSVPADPRVWREAQTLRQHNYEISIICPCGTTRDSEPYSYIEGIHIYRYPLATEIKRATDYSKEYLLAMLRTLGLTVKVWRRHGFDVIHAANPPDTFFLIGRIYQLFGKKFVFDQHDLAPEMFRIKFKDRMQPLYRLLKFFEYLSYHTANIVITTNESQKRNALQRGKCHTDKVVVVRNGPDLIPLHTISYNPLLKMGHPYLLAYIGVMGIQDGVDYVLYALNELVNKRGHQDIGLVLMGDGDQLAHLQQLTVELQLSAYVHFTGWLEKQELLRYLRVADIGLSPDPSNPLNDHSTMLKTMEYMLMGLPVVAFDLLETRYSAQEAALYATNNNIVEYADMIERLLADSALRQRMGAYGRQRVEAELSWLQSRQHLLRAYEKLFSQPHTYTAPQAQQPEQEHEPVSYR
jgi:Glycosyltransferase